ncbi:MAG: lytic murein transglycosylase [Alphaproteobacteria bacterium]|nr:MAG: lytic murein transglycosylase [Alphaproteobacteria bacterium]TAF15763.1 MAG: lytic murein transglycosylase [Alphaproteobacteria bacterium]TAF40296.1 MAG: lytic murein transglycosylase [Alphaproteobacteria bacterium]TAF75283.1 MAG: lytic murein transglycosylase [Alphaproteobacteria bacterium]
MNIRVHMIIPALILVVLMVFPMVVKAQTTVPRTQEAFVSQLRAKAQSQGISERLLDQVFHGFTVDHKAIASDKSQAEDRLRFTKYRKNIVSDYRVKRGRALYAKHRMLLDKIAKEYGVPAPYIVALWGTETSFGAVTGNHNIPRALATLAYEGRREELFTNEFILALKMIQEGHVSYDQMKGSWAGAMGQCQFMPSSFFNYAVDYDGDGRKNIWHSLPDVFASIANYLKQSGWIADQRWGRQILLPTQFDVSQEDINAFRPLSFWSSQGVRFAHGGALPQLPMQAAFIFPGSPEEGAYLIYPNFHVLLKWNFSRLFATAVGLLADEIAR